MLNRQYLFILISATFLFYNSCNAIGEIWNLKVNWSEGSNPNGAWSYRNLSRELLDQHLTDWLVADFGSGQPAWKKTGGAEYLGFAKMVHDGSEAPIGSQWDYLTGDVLGHAPYHVRWTCPQDMQIKVFGSVWRIRENDSAYAYLKIDGSFEEYIGDLGMDTSAHYRNNPLMYDYLLDVITGQQIELYIGGNDFVAVEMTIFEITKDRINEFYVSPDGNDGNDGSKEHPFATIDKAKEAVRLQIALGLTDDVVVYIRDGIYYLNETLQFNIADSGTATYKITYAAYPGETPVISGVGWALSTFDR